MHFSWHQHLEAARMISVAEPKEQGTALALMGLALLLLANDLLESEPNDNPSSSAG